VGGLNGGGLYCSFVDPEGAYKEYRNLKKKKMHLGHQWGVGETLKGGQSLVWKFVAHDVFLLTMRRKKQISKEKPGTKKGFLRRSSRKGKKARGSGSI